MTPAELVAEVQALADGTNAGYPQRRRGMKPEVAQAIIALCVEEAVERARGVVETWYGGDRVLSHIRGMCQTSRVGPSSTNGNGVGHG